MSAQPTTPRRRADDGSDWRRARTESPSKRVHWSDPRNIAAAASEQLLREERAATTASRNSGQTPTPRKSNDTGTQAAHPIVQEAAVGLSLAEREELAADEYVSRKLIAIQNTISELCKKHVGFKLDRKDVRDKIVGGPRGKAGWEELLVEPTLRKALVQGIISRALKEHVLSSLAFGAPEKLLVELTEMEREQKSKDAFYRASMRTTHIESTYGSLAHEKWDQTGPILRLTIQLEAMLLPVLELSPAIKLVAPATLVLGPFARDLVPIIKGAADLNGFIRENGAAVYFFQPVYKENEFEPDRMECMNVQDMQNCCLLDAPGMQANDPNRDSSHKALVRVISSLNCVAYRKGGGFMAEALLEKEKLARKAVPHTIEELVRMPAGQALREAQRKVTADDGIRTRVLTKAGVTLYWERPESLADGEERVDLLEVFMGAQETEEKRAMCAVM
ncbi:hypothetical protein MBLNU459_g3754t3 [Dothideomycetes sp. NU459]